MATIGADEMLSLVVNDAVLLRFAWNNYRYLFENPERVSVLNAAAPSYFRWTQMLLIDDVLMRIARLTDPAGNRWQENVTLEGLLQATGWDRSDRSKWQRFSEKLLEVRTACEGCRAHRNKRLSHADVGVAAKALTLPVVTHEATGEAIAAIEGFIHAVFPELRPNSQQSFNIVEGDRYVEQLITYLKNRPSRKMAGAVSVIRAIGDRWGELRCGFCGEVHESYLPDLSGLDADRLRYWHFGACAYIVGTETISLDVFVQTGDTVPTRVTVDLSEP